MLACHLCNSSWPVATHMSICGCRADYEVVRGLSSPTLNHGDIIYLSRFAVTIYHYWQMLPGHLDSRSCEGSLSSESAVRVKHVGRSQSSCIPLTALLSRSRWEMPRAWRVKTGPLATIPLRAGINCFPTSSLHSATKSICLASNNLCWCVG